MLLLSKYLPNYIDKLTFSISDLEQLAGISNHTIRIWERRYKALTPARSSGNTRLYSNDQLRRLLNIVSLVQTGLKISSVCALDEAGIENLLKKEMDKTISKNEKYEYYTSQLISAGFDYNEVQVNNLFSKCVRDFGIPETYKNVIYPLLVRLGLMWRMDKFCPSQEHFLTSIIRQKIFTAIDGLPFKIENKASWLLFLPEDEDHDIGLLLANYLLRAAGHKVIYLGPKVPLDAVKNVVSKNNMDNLLLFMVKNRPLSDIKEYLSELSTNFTGSKIHLAGSANLLDGLEPNPNINRFRSLEEFEQIIKLTTNDR